MMNLFKRLCLCFSIMILNTVYDIDEFFTPYTQNTLDLSFYSKVLKIHSHHMMMKLIFRRKFADEMDLSLRS